MRFFNQLSVKLRSWMSNRNGLDQLGMFTLMAGLVLSLLGSILRVGTLSFLGLAVYIVTIFRMFSRNLEARRGENQKYIRLTGDWALKIRQFVRRQKNRKEYRYFKCPQCKQLLRLKRGCGEKEITCAKCGHQFHQKA